MAKRDEPRFTPQYRSAAHAATTGVAPHWFLREAVGVFGLGLPHIAAFFVIADNLDADGVSRTATGLIVDRAGMSRSTAVKAVATLLEHRLIIELDEKRSGAIMRYAIPRDRPLSRREVGI